jgi:hypothetical protein
MDPTAPDIFLIHAGPDTAIAEKLYDLLSSSHKVFLDSKCLQPGDLWPDVLQRVTKNARMSVILVSRNTDPAFYEQSEIVSAIQSFRETKRRLVPIYVGGKPGKEIEFPYGLNVVQGIEADPSNLQPVAAKLRQLLTVSAALPAQPIAERSSRIVPAILGSAAAILLISTAALYFVKRPATAPDVKPTNPVNQGPKTGGPISELRKPSTIARSTPQTHPLLKTEKPRPAAGITNHVSQSTETHQAPTTSDCAQAVPELERLVRINPREAELNYRLGACLIRQGKLDDARRSLNQAYELGKDPASVFTELARAAWQDHDAVNALHYVGKALDATQEFAPAMLLQGEILLGTGHPPQAYKILRDLWAEKKTREICLAFQRASRENGLGGDPADCGKQPE